MPHINHVLRGFYKKYPESVEISLESIGESSATTKPTILVICTSVHKVRSILKKHLVYDKSTYGLKVCRGKVVRSGVKRSMAGESENKPKNAEHQERPANGASIGAYVDEQHFPPVSFGGAIVVDGTTYGMTVHHMLDCPSEADDEDIPILRSSARASIPDLSYSESSLSSGDEEYMYGLSDYESDFSTAGSEYDSSDDSSYDEPESEPGDIPGIPIGCGESYLITQPALDDITPDFYPDPSTRDEDHIDSFQLGEIYASSGIRRRIETNIVHEIDWALFTFEAHRSPSPCPSSTITGVKPSTELPNSTVHCSARTSGMQNGRILEAMTSVKIYGRQTPSSSFQVAGGMGVPGDSGAWVVGDDGRACGVVLAWSARKKVAYICPMDVLVRDVGETVGAGRICMAGGEEVWPWPRVGNEKFGSSDVSDGDEEEDEGTLRVEDEELNRLLAGLNIPDQGYVLERGRDTDEFLPIRMMPRPESGSGKSMRSFVRSVGRGSVTVSEERGLDSEIEVGGDGGRGL